MPVRAAISWLEARGWLVLAGSVRSSEAIRARALAVAAADGGVAILACAGENDAVEQLLIEFEDLGAQSGYIVDVFVEDDRNAALEIWPRPASWSLDAESDAKPCTRCPRPARLAKEFAWPGNMEHSSCWKARLR